VIVNTTVLNVKRQELLHSHLEIAGRLEIIINILILMDGEQQQQNTKQMICTQMQMWL